MVRRLKRRVAPGALILMYHRIAELPTDSSRLGVTSRHFDEHLEVLRRHAHPIPLRDLEGALTAGQVPPRAVVVTADDGYLDNLLNARPLLERHDVPATIFVASGSVGSEREFWWDELDRLLLQAGRLPDTLRIAVDHQAHEWSLGEAACYGEDAFEQHRRWHLERGDDPTPRQHLYRDLCRLLRPLAERDRRPVLDGLRAWAGVGAAAARPSHRVLRPAELASLAEGGLIEVGAHSVTHPMLSELPVAEQRDEIRRSKIDLENMLGQPVLRFAYPYGARTAETVALVREAGFHCACAGVGAVRSRTDRFQLPRCDVRDWDGDAFAGRLQEWFLG